MKIAPNFGGLDFLLERMGLRPAVVALDVAITPPPKFGSIETTIALADIEFDQDGLFRIGGEPVFLYIHEIRNPFPTVEQAVQNPRSLRRFHFCDCTVIQKMRAQNRFERYVATNKTEGPFRCFLKDQAGHPHEVMADLIVCQNCLQRLNWNKFNQISPKARRKIAEQFTRIAFLERHSPSFVGLPSRRAETVRPPAYPENWREISRQIRAARGFRCEVPVCRVDCSSRPSLTDAHHVSGDVTDCRPENLLVLCKLCHADEHPGWYRVTDTERREIEALRRLQGAR